MTNDWIELTISLIIFTYFIFIYNKLIKFFSSNFKRVDYYRYLHNKIMFDLIPDYVKQAPFYHLAIEGFLLVWILWLIFRKSYSPTEKNKLTEKVI